MIWILSIYQIIMGARSDYSTAHVINTYIISINSGLGLEYGVQRHFQQYFNYIVTNSIT